MFSISFFIGLLLIGIVAGFASGLLGVGGGFLMVPLQFFLLKSEGISPEIAMLVSLATSLAIIIPTALSGAYQHQKKNKEIIKPGVTLGLFGIVGGFFGGFIATIIPSSILQFIFGILLFVVALDMIFGFKREGESSRFNFNLLSTGILGVIIGILSGLLGVGGGVFIVPALTLLFGFSLVRAIGVSSVFISLTAIGGLCSYIYSGFGVNTLPFSLGWVSLINFVFIAALSIPMATIGAKLVYKIPEKRLKQVFAIVLIYMGLKMMGFDPLYLLSLV